MPSKYVAFDPKIHKPGVKLYEVVTVGRGDVRATAIQESRTPYERAAQSPWFYLVRSDEAEQA